MSLKVFQFDLKIIYVYGFPVYFLTSRQGQKK